MHPVLISGYAQFHGWSIWGPSQKVLHNVTSICQAQVILFPIAQGSTTASAVKGLSNEIFHVHVDFPQTILIKNTVGCLSLKHQAKLVGEET